MVSTKKTKPETFCFRKEKYIVDEVVAGVLEILPAFEGVYQEALQKLRHPQPPNRDFVQVYGVKFFQERAREEIERQKRDAVKAALNQAFLSIISGTCHSHLNYLPTDLAQVRREHVRKMLDDVRGLRRYRKKRAYPFGRRP